MSCRCIKISLVRFLAPRIWFPSKSTRHRSSGLSEPLLTSVGVQMAISSPMRTAMLPPLPSTYARCHCRRPISQMCAFRRRTGEEWKSAWSFALGEWDESGLVDVEIFLDPVLPATLMALLIFYLREKFSLAISTTDASADDGGIYQHGGMDAFSFLRRRARGERPFSRPGNHGVCRLQPCAILPWFSYTRGD